MNDEGKPQNDPAPPDELIEQLNLLEAVDRRITPEHVTQRFHELLESADPPGPADVDRQAPRESGNQHVRPRRRRLPEARPQRIPLHDSQMPAIANPGWGMNVAVATVPWWLLELERQAHDSAAEATTREIVARLHTSAHAYAYKLVGADAEDAVQTAWARTLATYDPESRPLSLLFSYILHNTCRDMWRSRRDETLPSDDVAALAESAYRAPYPADGGFEEEVLSRLADPEGRITAAIEALDLPAGHRDMLHSLTVSREADTTDATARKRRQRMRDSIDDLAGLTPAERRAVSLQRKHRALDADTQALVASARLKVLRLFDIQTED